MLNKPQAKDKVLENPAAKEIPKEAVRVQERVMAEKVKALEKVERVKKVLEMEKDKAKAKVEKHPLIREVPLICPEMMAMLEHPLML